ncbi:MAG: flagellar basal body rod protein FlgB [Anaerolinea sp.]|nr:flagellar basal body rod protein FlgB [Anaerolinea sp.]
MSWLQDPIHRTLSGALNGLALRESLVAGNLANIDTPGYSPKSVDFEGVLRAELARDGTPVRGASTPPIQGGMLRTDPRHLDSARPPERDGPGASMFAGSIRNDGNGVDLESEMAALAETQLRFAAVGRLMTGRLAMLRDAITGGR